MVVLKYIFKNLGRKKKQSFFTLLCISVSSVIVLADFALLNGIETGLKDGVNEVLSGQITVYGSDNDRMNILESQLKEQIPFEWNDSDKLLLQQKVPNAVVYQRIRIGSLISYEEETSYIHFHALEKEHLEKVNSMLTFREGRMAKNEKEIVISESMSKDLNCVVDDTVLLVANNIYDYMSDMIGIVSGVFEKRGLAIFLGYNGFMPYQTGKELTEVGEGSSIELVLNPLDGDDFTKEELAGINTYFQNTHPDLRLVSWEHTAPLLYSIVKVWTGGGVITQVIFILFSLIILITLTSLIVHSRRQEFGTFLAIGFSWNRVKLFVCAEYALLCGFSVLLGYVILEFVIFTLGGNGITIDSNEMQSALMTDRLFLFVQWKDVVYVLSLFILTTILSAFISVQRLLRKQEIKEMINT